MLDNDSVESVIFKALESLNEEQEADEKVDIRPDTQLFGVDAEIDSLSLVSVIVDVETEITSVFGVDISLTDDRAMTREETPFKSVETLKAYILEIAAEQ